MTKEWFIDSESDQWFQTYYRFRDGKLYLYRRDNKDQHDSEDEVDIDAFLREHATTRTAPYPDLVAFLADARRRS